jgi:hypothetical protein
MHILITGSVCEYAPYFILKRRMTQEQEIDLKIQKFVAYCKENKLHVEGVEKTYKPDNVFEYENKIIARLAMFRNLQILVELYLEGGIGLYFNMFSCDSLTAAVLTKKFLEDHQVDVISSFVEMRNKQGELERLLFGQEAIDQYTKEKYITEPLSQYIN